MSDATEAAVPDETHADAAPPAEAEKPEAEKPVEAAEAHAEPVEEVKATEEAKPAEEVKPVEEAKAEEAKPAEEAKAEEAKPAEEAKAEEAKPVEESKAEEAKPAGEEHAAAAEEPAKVDGAAEAPAEEMAAAAEEAKVEEPPKAPPPPPVIKGIEPDRGPLAGGTTVTITGEHFAEDVRVFLGSVEAKTTRESETSLRVEVPAGAAKGSVGLLVVHGDGESDEREDAFTYEAPPAITGVEPVAATTKGGTVLTILGSDFAEGCSVFIDDKAVPVSRAHAGRLEAVLSAHDPGEVTVHVKNPDGQRGSLAGALRFAEAPFVAKLVPAQGVTTGGTEVVISGRHFVEGCAVLFGGKPLDAVGYTSDTELRITTPGHHASESVDVAVVNPDGLVHRLPLAFAYVKAPPRIASVSPAFGPNAGGTKLAIQGTDFDKGCHVYVCGLAAAVTWKSREEIEIVTPPVARDGLVEIRIVNTDDQLSTLANAFRYDAPLPPPVLTAVSPGGGSQVGGTKVTLFGDDFAEGAVVRFGGIAAETRFVTRKQLEATAPAYAGSGEVAVEVVNPDGVTATLEAAFVYEARPGPTIASITPQMGPTTGGTKVVIEGTNFTKDAQVYVGREYPKDQVVKSATEIHIITAPRKMAGVVDIEVAVPGVPRAALKNAFRFDAVPAPVITSVAPNAGGVAGGTELTIAGKNFRKDSIVLVDGKPPKTVKFVDAQTIELKTPPGEPSKMVDVIVRNPDGKEAVQKRAFLYDPRYR
jgi:hypothetical protein